MCSSSRRCGTTRPGAACRYANQASSAYASQVTRSRWNATASGIAGSEPALEAAAARVELERVLGHVDGLAVVEADAPASLDPARLPDDEPLGSGGDTLRQRLVGDHASADVDLSGSSRTHRAPVTLTGAKACAICQRQRVTPA